MVDMKKDKCGTKTASFERTRARGFHCFPSLVSSLLPSTLRRSEIMKFLCAKQEEITSGLTFKENSITLRAKKRYHYVVGTPPNNMLFGN